MAYRACGGGGNIGSVLSAKQAIYWTKISDIRHGAFADGCPTNHVSYNTHRS